MGESTPQSISGFVVIPIKYSKAATHYLYAKAHQTTKKKGLEGPNEDEDHGGTKAAALGNSADREHWTEGSKGAYVSGRVVGNRIRYIRDGSEHQLEDGECDGGNTSAAY